MRMNWQSMQKKIGISGINSTNVYLYDALHDEIHKIEYYIED